MECIKSEHDVFTRAGSALVLGANDLIAVADRRVDITRSARAACVSAR
ncbi:MAG: hypothetical protein HKN44_02460 [Ilumatobacter sp.]|nr:hypothetical protein [Ilumatobacter sp.]